MTVYWCLMGLGVVYLLFDTLRSKNAKVNRILAELPPLTDTDREFASLVERFNMPSSDGQGPQQ